MRGDVYRLRADRNARGHEQKGDRYAIIVHADYINLSTWIVVPTSTKAGISTVRPQVSFGDEVTFALTDQIMTIDPEKRIGNFVGRISYQGMMDIDNGIKEMLGFI